MLHKTATPNVGIYVATTVHHCVMECCAMTTKGVINVSGEISVQPTTQSTPRRRQPLGLEKTRWFGSWRNVPNIGYWLSVIHGSVRVGVAMSYMVTTY